MSDKKLLKEITKDLSVLCIDDEPLAREYLAIKLKRMFKNVYTADDGSTGLKEFRDKNPDLIITDNRMTFMDGIDMIGKIREENQDIPIILATAYTEKDALVDAINYNVNQFLSKPIDSKKLDNAIDKSLQSIINARLAEKALTQEIELLRYREKYHSHQENNAFKKELSLILNDYFLQKFSVKNKIGDEYGVFMNILYKPLDVLSGDIYSIRKLDDGKVFVFLADSMGKGLPASVTSILTTAYMNHIVDTEGPEVTSSLQRVIESFNKYIRGVLLDDEILSISLIKFDFVDETMEYASFSLPPIMVKSSGGEVSCIRCNNPPLNKYLTEFKIDTVDISDITGILLMTDGLYECGTKEGSTVMGEVKEAFEKNIMKTDFHKYMDSIIGEPEDDVSCIHITKIKKECNECIKTSFEASLKNVGKAIEWLEGYFEESELNIEDSSMLTLAFTELTMNAFEHSVLGLDNRQKYKMINDGEYDTFIGESKSDKLINVAAGIREMHGKRFVYINIKDEGKGFDPHILKIWMYDKDQNDGKGVKISRRIIDEIYYSADGREAIIIRVLDS